MNSSSQQTLTDAVLPGSAHGYSPEDLLGPLNSTELKNSPQVLFARGDTSLLAPGTPRVAIVGTRKPTDEGLRRARRLARSLADDGVVVVSGLAAGIDSAAHRSAIEAGGSTIAVLGTPLDRCYPASNRELQDEIGRRHLLVSQFSSGSKTGPWSFPMRNRTMALISDATVIVEANEKSGTISQGWEAIRLRRELFLMKSLVDAGLEWPKQLIDYGASVLSDPDELIDYLPTTTPQIAFAL